MIAGGTRARRPHCHQTSVLMMSARSIDNAILWEGSSHHIYARGEVFMQHTNCPKCFMTNDFDCFGAGNFMHGPHNFGAERLFEKSVTTRAEIEFCTTV